MKLSFKINLGNYQMMGVESSEFEKWESCMREIFLFLQKIDHPAVQKFVKEMLSVEVKGRIKSKKPK